MRAAGRVAFVAAVLGVLAITVFAVYLGASGWDRREAEDECRRVGGIPTFEEGRYVGCWTEEGW